MIEFINQLTEPPEERLNMQADLDLLAKAGEGLNTLRLYTWQEQWVTLGVAQSPEKALVHPDETKWLTRPTGGGAVLHGHDITLGIALNLKHLIQDQRHGRRVVALYRTATQPLVVALRDCGMDAELAEERIACPASLSAEACFSGTSPNDIIDRRSGRKICGCAMKVTSKALLLQISIPISKPIRPARELIVGAYELSLPTWYPEKLPEALQLQYSNLTPT